MPQVVQQWKDWYSGAYDPPPYIAGYGNFWLNILTKGVWEKVSADTWVYRGKLGDDAALSSPKMLYFSETDWANNRITIIPTGTPVHGEIGAHGIPPRAIMTSVMMLDGAYSVVVEMDIVFDYTTGRINLYKSSLIPSFSGLAELRFVE